MSNLPTLEIVRSRIVTLPGRPPFMLAADLAEFYGVRTDAVTQAVKRHQIRFPEDFVFTINSVEREQLITQNVLSNMHSRALPMAFTDLGAYALCGVLRSVRAAEVSVIIFRAFAALLKETAQAMRAKAGRAISFYMRHNKPHAHARLCLDQGMSYADIKATAPRSWTNNMLVTALQDCHLDTPELPLPADMPRLRSQPIFAVEPSNQMQLFGA